MEDVQTNVDHVDTKLVIPKPKVSEIYYSYSHTIDQYNVCHQESLDLKKKLRIHEWDKRENMSILGMCVINTWLCFCHMVETDELWEDFYLNLAEELINNNQDGIGFSIRVWIRCKFCFEASSWRRWEAKGSHRDTWYDYAAEEEQNRLDQGKEGGQRIPLRTLRSNDITYVETIPLIVAVHASILLCRYAQR